MLLSTGQRAAHHKRLQLHASKSLTPSPTAVNLSCTRPTRSKASLTCSPHLQRNFLYKMAGNRKGLMFLLGTGPSQTLTTCSSPAVLGSTGWRRWLGHWSRDSQSHCGLCGSDLRSVHLQPGIHWSLHRKATLQKKAVCNGM